MTRILDILIHWGLLNGIKLLTVPGRTEHVVSITLVSEIGG